MSLRGFFVLAFILHILVIQFTTARVYFEEDASDSDDSDENRVLKRLFFHKTTESPTKPTPSVLGNLVFGSSTAARPSIWTQKSTYSPLYPSSGACTSNLCEHGGICIPTGQMIYDCKCVGPWRGVHCSVADACYRSPCQNDGTCLNVYDDYWCKCPSDYYGVNCQSKFSTPSYSEDNCRPNICNSGRCVSLKTTYYCQCPDNRYGDHCEKRFAKRQHTNFPPFLNFLNQSPPRLGQDKDMELSQRDEDVAYYDVKNGIYFKK